jgi:hypothetical protein
MNCEFCGHGVVDDEYGKCGLCGRIFHMPRCMESEDTCNTCYEALEAREEVQIVSADRPSDAPEARKPDDGGSAFPRTEDAINHRNRDFDLDGMTLRDYFATHAPPMTDQWWKDSKGDGHHWVDADAAWRYAHANAMLKARGQS